MTWKSFKHTCTKTDGWQYTRYDFTIHNLRSKSDIPSALRRGALSELMPELVGTLSFDNNYH